MSDDTEDTIDTRGLDKIVKMMGQSMPSAKVGILGTHAARNAEPGKSSGPNNAEVGSFHEYGSGNNPQRSFLRVPISELLDKQLESSGALDEDVLKEALASGSFVPYMKKVAAVAEKIVLGAFDSSGYGKWLESNMKYKKNSQTLVETTQLRNSISTEVKEGSE